MSGKASRCLTCGEWFHVDAPWWHWCRGNTADELTVLRQQVADLRAALEAAQRDLIAVRDLPSSDLRVREIAFILAATQPQEVQP